MITCLYTHDLPMTVYIIYYQTSKELEFTSFIRLQWFLSALKFPMIIDIVFMLLNRIDDKGTTSIETWNILNISSNILLIEPRMP